MELTNYSFNWEKKCIFLEVLLELGALILLNTIKVESSDYLLLIICGFAGSNTSEVCGGACLNQLRASESASEIQHIYNYITFQ